MPAWWRGKSKSSPKDKDKDKSKSPSAAELRPREKAKSFDEAMAAKRRAESAEAFSFDSDADRKGGGGCGRVGHPLPRPAVAASASLQHDHGSAGASASVSSVSSSGSSEETPDLGVYRYSEPVNTPRGRSTGPESQRQHQLAEERSPLSCSPVLEHERVANLSTSPRSGFQGHSSNTSSNGSVYPHHVASTESMFNPGSRSPGPRSPRSQGYTFPVTSPNSRGFGTCTESPIGKYNDLRSPPHPLPLPPGSPTSPASRSLLSKWKKGRLLGRGTFGHVYEGFNSESGQMCAIKEVEIISDDSNSKECLRQLAQEINLLSQLSHPNIVQYYGSELVGDALSVYLEYVSGGSIHKLLQEYGPFNEPVIRSYTRQILSGLAYLHGRNTFHRDIKGANILVDPIGEIKLADFGMAKHISSFASIRSFKGSPYWMAPEVIMNSNGYNLSVDIWSLGCTIIEMATAKPPWSQFTGVQAIFKIGNSKDIPDIPEHLSDEGKRFLKLCLQRDPSTRPTAAQLLDHPFVRDNTKVKVSLPNLIKDPHPSPSDGSRSPTTSDFGHNRSISPLQTRDLPLRQTVGGSPAYRNQSDALSLRMNMSLPVSPCSSPLRQFRQSNNRSCLPSPPHPAYMAGTSNYGLSNYTQYPLGASSRYNDLCADVSRTNGLTPYGSPRS